MENRVNTDGNVPRDQVEGTPGTAPVRPPRPTRGSASQPSMPTGPEDSRQTAARPAASANAPMPGQPVGSIPYQRTRPHITQEPIADDPTRYVTRERYATLEQTRPRRHMGVATSDPQYLPVTEPGRGAQPGAHGDVPGPAPPASGKPAPLHYDRYLQTPKPGKTIFSSRHERARRRTRAFIIAVLLVTIAIALVWLFVLR